MFAQIIRIRWVRLSPMFLGFVLFSSGCFLTNASNSGVDPSTNGQPVSSNSNIETARQASGEQSKQVLWDFRSENTKEQKFTKAETQAVMKFLFGDTWDKDLDISSRLSGSFTKPNANETLYYVGGCKEDDDAGFKSTSNCAHVSWWNDGRIAIFDGTTPILKTEAVLGYQVVKVTDVNGDGISEIFSLAGYSNGGETETSGALGQIADGKYKEIKTFGRAAADTCGYDPSFGALQAKASVISYIPATGKMPEFTEEYFQNKCGKTPWKKITKKQFDAD